MNRIRRWLHDKLGWGYPDYLSDAGSYVMPTYECRYCDYAVTMDSQGNWFHLPRRSR